MSLLNVHTLYLYVARVGLHSPLIRSLTAPKDPLESGHPLQVPAVETVYTLVQCMCSVAADKLT